jgi:hypothetical protein
MAFEEGGAGGADTGGAGDLLGGAGGDGGAAGGAPAGGADTGGTDAGGDQGAGAADPDWFANLSAEAQGETASNRDWAKAAGVKDLDGLAKIARDSMAAARGKGLQVPGDDAKPEDIAAFRTAIGVPDDAKGYEIKGPDGVELNAPVLERLAAAAHKSGIPKGAFQETVAEFIQIQMDDAAAETARQDELATNWVKEQGAKKDEQLAHVNSAARALGLSSKDMSGLRSGLGADRALGLLAKLGAGMAEDVMITGGKGRFGIGGAEAQVELDKLKTDTDFQAKAKVAGSPERVRWDRLNQAAAEHRAAQDAKQ